MITDFGHEDDLMIEALSSLGGQFDMVDTVNGLEINVTYPHDSQYSQTVILQGIQSYEVVEEFGVIRMKEMIEGTDHNDWLQSVYHHASIMTGGAGAYTFHIIDNNSGFSNIMCKVTGLQYHTIGGVITPGASIMDIVPDDDRLIVEARVRPQDIDIVHQGLQAKVMLNAYKSRAIPLVEGEVLQVSADSFSDEATGEPYYLARVLINPEALERLTTHVELYPGMPAEVFITTGERTLLQYLLSPITDSFRRAFKEE